MSLYLQFVASAQLFLAILLGMIIGIERDRRNQPAGLRTHMLVCMGACLFTIVSLNGFPGGDPSRVAAQVVSGIGFLGAGTILQRNTKNSSEVKHLTTASSIWATAAIGMAVGIGAWFMAICGTLFVWFILVVMKKFKF
ncbi:hypothetical protein MASR2M15_13000 [Anaerolineales bacterium]